MVCVSVVVLGVGFGGCRVCLDFMMWCATGLYFMQ